MTGLNAIHRHPCHVHPAFLQDAIEVKATDHTLVISADHRNPRELPAGAESKSPLMGELRHGTWRHSFRFPQAMDREQLQATYRDGLELLALPTTNKVTTRASPMAPIGWGSAAANLNPSTRSGRRIPSPQ